MIATRVLLFVAPIALFLAWLLLRTASGRRPSRFTVNVALSLLLLVYFAGVVGTGIFWVAAQELPVFDWHYLLGYLFLALAVTHLVLNWRQVAAFVRRRAPSTMRTPDGRSFRSWVRTVAMTGLLVAVAAAVFVAGGQYASRTAVVVIRSDGTALDGARDARGAVETRDDSVARKQPIAPSFVRLEEEDIPLALYYHRGSSYPARSRLTGITWEARPEVYKSYPDAPSIELPQVQPERSPSVLEAARAWRSGAERLAVSSMSLEDLALLLHHTQGISDVLELPGRSFDLRTAPSAGALFPVDLYVVATRVEGLEPGLYHYQVREHALERIRSGPVFTDLESACDAPHLFQPAAATFVFTATFARTGFKYKERCYRYVHMDTGHAAFNLGLAAAALGFAFPVVARFDDGAMNRMIGIEPSVEAVLLVGAVGRPLEGIAATILPRPIFAAVPLDNADGIRFLDLIHGGTDLRRTGEWGEPVPRTATGFASESTREADFALPEPTHGRDLLPSIRVRRSIRNHSSSPIEPAELAALCEAAVGAEPPGERFLATTAPLSLYVAIRDVRGIDPGLYRYLRDTRSLRLLRAGDFAERCYVASYRQDFCGTADALFVKTVRWTDLLRPDGDRGYRYACLRSGMIGEGIYLQAAALGIGVCGVGAFLDGEVAALVGCDPDEEAPLYLTAVGR